jgi:large subunit ribosomal protein L10
MSKAVKQLVVAELTQRLRGVSALLACSTKGLTAQEAVGFRAALRQKNVRALTVKNAMCRRAFKAVGLEYAAPLLDGPTTLVYGGESVADTAKALVAQAGKFKIIQVRGGAGDGALLSAADVEALSKLPSRDELLGIIIGGLLAPVGGVVGALMAPAQQVASQIEKLGERAEAQAA